MVKGIITLMAAALLITGASVCLAQSTQVSLNAQDMKIEEAAAELTKQTGIQIVCDTGVKGTVSGNFTGMEVEALLDIVTKSNNLKWQKLFFPAQAEKKPTMEQIKAQADALAALADMPLVVYDPITKKQSVFVRQAPESPTVTPDKLGLKPLYLISNPKTQTVEKKEESGSDLMSRYQLAQQERDKALMAMTPEQRVAALQQEMMSQLGMDPDQRAQMMRDEFTARRNMDPNLRDQYRQMMRETFRRLREQGAIPDWGRGDRGNRGPRDGFRGERRQRTPNSNGG